MSDSQLLAEIDTLRSRTRADLKSGAWRWMVVWVAVSLGFVVALAIPDLHDVAATYWAFGVPVGIAGTVLADLAHGERRVRRREWPYWATASAITIANVAGSLWLPTGWMLLWLWVVLASGFSVLLWLEQEAGGARLLAGLAVAFLVLAPLVSSRLEASIAMGAAFTLVLATIAWMGFWRDRA